MPIQLLDSSTISKIAAGEVIDRPSSIVKELIENSIDAGATTITVDMEKGGKQLIRISDNGCGIQKDDLPNAPVRHATSKISCFDDVFTVNSLGFRGEALSSIAHVAELDIYSKHKSDDHAYMISAKQDQISSPSVTTHNQGTSIEVKRLFYDIPVRKSFLKADSTETAYIYDSVLHFALMFPNIDFKLVHNHVVVFNSYGIADTQTLLVHTFGKELKDKLVPVDVHYSNLHVTGVISDPTLTFSNRTKQFYAVNKRLVKMPLLTKALQQSFVDMIPKHRFPLAVLSLELIQKNVDVNIHPQKQTIKFLNPSLIFEALPKIVTISLKTANRNVGPYLDPHTSYHTSYESNSFQQAASNRPQTPFNVSSDHSKDNGRDNRNDNNEQKCNNIDSQQKNQDYQSKSSLMSAHLQASHLQAPLPIDTRNLEEMEFLQILDTYIVIKSPSGLWILDQHAVHERILYEKIKEQHRLVTETQRLLISECVDLGTDLFHVFQSESSTFSQLRFKIEEFGLNQVIIREVPLIFSDVSMSDWIKSFLIQLKEIPGAKIDLTQERKERLQKMACVAAIKAGKTLHKEEVYQLIRDFQRSPSNFTCPHGRPLYIKITKSDLEKLFLRI